MQRERKLLSFFLNFSFSLGSVINRKDSCKSEFHREQKSQINGGASFNSLGEHCALKVKFSSFFSVQPTKIRACFSPLSKSC